MGRAETVYGLGANAFDEPAVRSIFARKGRPLNDPVICHVPGIEDIWALTSYSTESIGGKAFRELAFAFWPGPLTIVVPASERVPGVVAANTGWVGIRCPNHPIALGLLCFCFT